MYIFILQNHLWVFIISKEKSIRIISSHGRKMVHWIFCCLKIYVATAYAKILLALPLIILNVGEDYKLFWDYLELLSTYISRKDMVHGTSHQNSWFILWCKGFLPLPPDYISQYNFYCRNSMKETFQNYTSLHWKLSLSSMKRILLILAEGCLIWYKHAHQLLHITY